MQENIHLVPKIGKENGPGTLDTVLNFPSAGAVNRRAKKKKIKPLANNITFSISKRVELLIYHNFSYKGKKNVNL